MRFPPLRFIILILACLAQLYLFVRIRSAINSSRKSDRFKRQAILAVGAGIGLLFLLNTYHVFRPVSWLDPPLLVRIILFYAAAVWSLGSLFSAVLLLAVQLAGIVGRLVMRVCRTRSEQSASVAVDQGRRLFLRVGIGGLAAAPVVLSGYGAAYAGRAYEVEELTLPFGHVLRVVQVTDIHAGVYMTRNELRRLGDQVIDLAADLFVLTGDYISNSMVFLSGCLKEMARVRARFGTFATLGNHEHMYGRLSQIQAVFQEHGILLLNNAHRIIHTEQGPFAVVGIDDLQRGDPDLDAALRGLDRSIPTLLLSHRPEIFPDAADRGIPLTLSGHYHGGQVKLILPGGGISLAHLRTPYPEGPYTIKDSRLYVSRGIGTTFTPVRLNAAPEITLFRLT